MARLADPVRYMHITTGVSLQDCVAHLLFRYLDKKAGAATNWSGDLTGEEIMCESNFVLTSAGELTDCLDAGLDTQATLEAYAVVSRQLRAKEIELGRIIPEDWYTHHYMDGLATRIVTSINGDRCPWTFTICPWYVSGAFSNYHM